MDDRIRLLAWDETVFQLDLFTSSFSIMIPKSKIEVVKFDIQQSKMCPRAFNSHMASIYIAKLLNGHI
jgi:hypothetical protein